MPDILGSPALSRYRPACPFAFLNYNSYHETCSLGCNTNYHHDYSVKDDVRTYYEGVPDVIKVGDHQFVEREVLNLFTGLMLISWCVHWLH